MSKVQVAVRIRPLLGSETDCKEVVFQQDKEVHIADRRFTYDYVFGSTSTQEQVYSQAINPLVESLFEGYNATVFA